MPQPQPDPIAPAPFVVIDHGHVVDQMWRAVEACASRAAAEVDPRGVQEAGAGALAFAQALAILDPSVKPKTAPQPPGGQQGPDAKGGQR